MYHAAIRERGCIVVVKLPPELEAYLAGKIANGTYPDADALIADTLRDRMTREQQTAELRAAINVGWEQAERGEVAPFDAVAILAEVRRKGAGVGQPSP